MLRGVLQGVGDYKGVGLSLIGEQGARLVTGAILAAAGLGVTGAYLGTPLSFIAMGVYCWYRLRRHVGAIEGEPLAAVSTAPPAALSLWDHVRRAWAPIAGLIVIAVLQNIDIIAAKHRFSTRRRQLLQRGRGRRQGPHLGGDGRRLLPRARGLAPSRRRQGPAADPGPGAGDRRGVRRPGPADLRLRRPTCSSSRRSAPPRRRASGSLLVLGLAFTVLACTYLAIQYMLALRRTWFLVLLAAVAVAEPILLLNASHRPKSFAAVVLAIQVVGALVAFAFALRPDRTPAPPAASGPTATGARAVETRARAASDRRAAAARRRASSDRRAGACDRERPHEGLDDRGVELAARAAPQLVQGLERGRGRGGTGARSSSRGRRRRPR